VGAGDHPLSRTTTDMAPTREVELTCWICDETFVREEPLGYAVAGRGSDLCPQPAGMNPSLSSCTPVPPAGSPRTDAASTLRSSMSRCASGCWLEGSRGTAAQLPEAGYARYEIAAICHGPPARPEPASARRVLPRCLMARPARRCARCPAGLPGRGRAAPRTRAAHRGHRGQGARGDDLSRRRTEAPAGRIRCRSQAVSTRRHSVRPARRPQVDDPRAGPASANGQGRLDRLAMLRGSRRSDLSDKSVPPCPTTHQGLHTTNAGVYFPCCSYVMRPTLWRAAACAIITMKVSANWH